MFNKFINHEKQQNIAKLFDFKPVGLTNNSKKIAMEIMRKKNNPLAMNKRIESKLPLAVMLEKKGIQNSYRMVRDKTQSSNTSLIPRKANNSIMLKYREYPTKKSTQ